MLVFTGVLSLFGGCARMPHSREELRELRRYETFPPESRSNTKEVRGKQIHYRYMGQGVPVILLHSFPGSSYEWRHVMPRLAKHYKVYALDLPGYGKSYIEPHVDRSLPAQVGYVSEWMDEMGIKSAILVGQDIGGGIAQIISVRYPRKVLGLVLINSVCFDSWPNDYVRLMGQSSWNPLAGQWAGHRSGFKQMLRKGVYYQALLSKGVMASYYEPWTGSTGRQNLRLAAQALDNRSTMEIGDSLPKVRVATLVIAGRFDPFQSIEWSRKLAASFPRGEFIAIPQCGHFATEDEPEKIARYTIDFFTQNAPGLR